MNMIFQLLSFLLFLQQVLLVPIGNSSDCLDPPNLKGKLIQYRLENEPYPTTHSERHSANFGNLLKDIGENSTCPASLNELIETLRIKKALYKSLGSNNFDTKVSTCPTYPAVSFNKNRYPKAIKQVMCRCTSSEGSGCLRKNGRTNLRFECVPVVAKILVLNKIGCKGHYAEYVPEWEEQRIGCSCRASSLFAYIGNN
ncbi:unnamed protein product [Dimorphilus gyrociliatus]|uniref:Uncharacterized protein n=1 Tax=Dimorphilus gyrociliatus TaxID=2664684 RepID=A0A7I8WA17_9ANNE|nr:unnamed protein product [Dimorphilus gyrociliatus]